MCKYNYAAKNRLCISCMCTCRLNKSSIRITITLACFRPLRHNYTKIAKEVIPAKINTKTAKVKALLEECTLNPTPGRVRDPRFRENEFFDPRDLVQVKYEMLRLVSVENSSVTEATGKYGVSRPTYYQTKASFDNGGLAGLAPRKRGPHGPHKLQGESLAFVEQQLVAGQPVRARELARLVRQKFDLAIHPRTIERAVAGKKKSR
jgi:transposase